VPEINHELLQWFNVGANSGCKISPVFEGWAEGKLGFFAMEDAIAMGSIVVNSDIDRIGTIEGEQHNLPSRSLASSY